MYENLDGGATLQRTRQGVAFGQLCNSYPQTPPDLVVKFQRIDIVDVILRLVLRPYLVYQREIKRRAALIL